MDEHRLVGVCTYIKDFMEWYSKDKSSADIKVYVEDRFSECSKDKKESICKIFNELSTKISPDGKWTSENYDTANNLLKVLW
jgi:hypothetical protein